LTLCRFQIPWGFLKEVARWFHLLSALYHLPPWGSCSAGCLMVSSPVLWDHQLEHHTPQNNFVLAQWAPPLLPPLPHLWALAQELQAQKMVSFCLVDGSPTRQILNFLQLLCRSCLVQDLPTAPAIIALKMAALRMLLPQVTPLLTLRQRFQFASYHCSSCSWAPC
jgi:hypothetical protein